MLGGRFYTEDELTSAGFSRVGRNVKIHNRCSIYCPENISIGDNVRIDDFAVLIATGPVSLGNFTHIPNFCFIGANAGFEMQDFATLAPGVHIYTSSDDYSGEALTNAVVPKQFTGGTRSSVVLERHVIIGASSVVLPGVTIGEGSSVGALSLVKTDLEPWGIYCGCPVRRLRGRSKGLLALASAVVSDE